MHNQLTPTKRAHVVTLKNYGRLFTKIGEELHCHPSTVYHTYQKWAEKENYYDITPGRGRPKCLDASDRRIACHLIKSGQAQTAADIQRDQFSGSSHVDNASSTSGGRPAWALKAKSAHDDICPSKIVHRVGRKARKQECHRLERCNLLR
jgi:transposase